MVELEHHGHCAGMKWTRLTVQNHPEGKGGNDNQIYPSTTNRHI